MNKTKKSVVVFLLAAALLISMVGMASASVTWYLEDNSTGVPTGADYWMRNGTGFGTSYVILDGTSKIWAANASATIDVNFGTEPWEVEIDFTECDLLGGYLEEGENITVRIGSLNSTSGAFTESMNFTEAGSGSGCGGVSHVYRETVTPSSAFQVPNGHYLALKLEMDTGDKVIVDAKNTASWVRCKTAQCPDYPGLPVDIDIKPGSCPNAFNPKRGGVMSVAVLGTEDFDVTTVDPETIRLEGVEPIRWNYEDVATPFEGELCDCHDLGGDGTTDLTLKFDNQELVETLGLHGKVGNITLTLTGNLYDGTPFEGQDCIWINKAKK